MIADREALAKVLIQACPVSSVNAPDWDVMYERERGYWREMADAALAWFAEHLDDGSNPLQDAVRNLINVVNGCAKPIPTDVLVAVEILAALTGAHDAR